MSAPLFKRLSSLLAILLITGVADADAAEIGWQQVIRTCAQDLQRGQQCGSCSAFWPEISRCAAQAFPGATPALVETCIERVNARDFKMPMAHDRSIDVIMCLAGHL